MTTKDVRISIPFALAVCLVICVGAPSSCPAQGTKADYARADGLRDLTRGKVFPTRVEPHWFANNTRFWYRNNKSKDVHEFVLVDAVKGEQGPAFDHRALAQRLTEATGQPHDSGRLPIEDLEFEDDGLVRFRVEGKGWRYDPKTGALEAEAEVLKETRRERGRNRPFSRPRSDRWSPRRDVSPDGQWLAFIRENNLYLRNQERGDEIELSRNATAEDAYEPRVFWSPDSKKLVALKTRLGEDRQVYLIESSPKDQLQPKLHSLKYAKPGDRLSTTKPHLFDVAQRKEIRIHDDLFVNPWSVGEIRWSPDSSRFTFLYNQRGHQVLRVVAVDAETGEARALIDERSPTFIDYAFKQYTHYLDSTNEIIWMSERDGWNHLYLYDSVTGKVKNQITRGEWVVRGVERVDDDTRQIWFLASGVDPSQDPYYLHLCRIHFDGTGFVDLTPADGTHEVTESPDHRFLVDTYSRVDLPPVTELRREADGSLVLTLEKADWTALRRSGWQVPERFVAKGRDGVSEIFGVIYRPTNFDAKKSYPVIEKIYAGPHGSFVPKAFAPYHAGQSMAELGFIVVEIDGMGTSNRSKAFHDVCWKNLGDSGFPDRILWIKAAAEKYPYMDLSRIGIYGGSAGGQSALRALLAHGDFYKVAVSDCGCHDNRMDKVWWNELWMGWPVGPHYAEQSNVTNAHRLTGKLLLIVGELDRNVDPASTMQVVDALIKADKDFDLLVVPGAGHGAGGGTYGTRRTRDFFVRHLLGVEPRQSSPANEAVSHEDISLLTRSRLDK